MKHHHMSSKQVKKRRKLYAALLSLPPLAALLMIGVVVSTNQAVVVVPEGVMLSPVRDTTPLIFSLLIFIVGYLVFIGVLFRESVEKFFVKKTIER